MEDPSLGPRQMRQVYLITYSQANEALISSRQQFAQVVVKAFDPPTENGPEMVAQWVCSQETRLDGGLHYHMAVKLHRVQRWLKIRNVLEQENGIRVNFSSNHSNYYSAWRYVTKEDVAYCQSEDHPDLMNALPPRTAHASQARADEQEEGRMPAKRKKKTRLTAFEVSQVAVSRGITSRVQLMAFANQQKTDGKTDLAEFIINMGQKVVEHAIQDGWEMEKAQETLERSKKSRLELLHEASLSDCMCGGQWRVCAKEILRNNRVEEASFSEACRELLEKGRGKYRNIMIIGPANCGKTFLLNPLNLLYKTFTNPASSTFAWVGAEKSEVIFLNDFRWSPSVLPWHDMLLLLEGQVVHLPAPKSHYASDPVFDSDCPIFATGKHQLVFVRGGAVDDRETEMMAARWRLFTFFYQIAEQEQKNVPSCVHCFARLIQGNGN